MAKGLALAIAMVFIICGPAAASSPSPEPLPGCLPLLVVDFGSLPHDCMQVLKERGFEVVALLPPSSVLLRAPAERALLSALPAPAAISLLQPREKLSGLLAPYLENGKSLPLTILFTGPRGHLARELEGLGRPALAWGRDSVMLSASLADLDALASLNDVYWIEPAPAPEPVNDHACRVLGARQWVNGAFQDDGSSLWSYNAASASFEGQTGAGVNVSIVDSGIDGSHPAFNGRKVAYFNYAGTGDWLDQGIAGTSGHGTMCAGIVAGDGSWRASDPSGQPGKYAGMAPGAGLIGQAIFQDSPGIAGLCQDALLAGAQVTSNSWAYYYSYGAYTAQCADLDSAVRDADPDTSGYQPLTIVFAAGNEGPTSMTVDAPSTAKNVITVGAIGNDRAGSSYGAYTSSQVVDFSSRGPCADGRIKPDVCAAGIDTYTTSALYNIYKGSAYDYLGRVPDDPDSSSYFAGGGTSAACPYVAGASALVVSYWRMVHGVDPSPALVKGLLINGAEPILGLTYPGNDQGWGRVNVSRSLVPGQGRNIITADQAVQLHTGDSVPMWLNVSSPSELKVTLVWTDVPGTPSARKALVNDLDLTMTDPDGNIFNGNSFSNGQSVAGGDPDTLNNVEGLLLGFPKPGKWKVEVRGSDVLEGSQDYALVISGPVTEIAADPAAVGLDKWPPRPLEGETVSMNFTVQNMGYGPAVNFPYNITVDGSLLQEGILPDLGAGDATVVRSNWTAVRGNHTLKMALNPLGTIDEINATNDTSQADITVLYFGVMVTASPAGLLLDPGTIGQFEGEVTNSGTAADTTALAFTADDPNWTASVEPAVVSLSPGESTRVILNVTCPPPALAGDSTVLTFRGTSRGNGTCGCAVDVRAVAGQVYSVRLSSPGAQQAFPWETAEFNLTVTNAGNGNDTIGLIADGEPEGWQVESSAGTLTMGARSEAPLKVRIKPPPDCWAGNSSAVTVNATSQGNVSSSTALVVTVRQFYDLSLSFVLLTNSSLPGGTAEAIFFVRNTGNGQDDIEVGLTAEPGWAARFNRSMHLPGYRTQGDSLSIQVPADALAGEHPMYFYVRSSGGPMRFANFTLRVEQVYAVEAVAVPDRQVIYQGESVTFTVSVTNLGNGNDSFELVPEGLPYPSSVSGNFGPLALGPGTTSSASLAVSDLTSPGQVNLTFRAASRRSPLTINYSTIGLLVLAIPQPPALPSDNIIFARNPGLGGGTEACGAVVILTAAVMSMLLIRRWRAQTRAAPSPPNIHRPAPPAIRPSGNEDGIKYRDSH